MPAKKKVNPKKKPVTQWRSNPRSRFVMPAIFVVAFAVIGTVALLLTHAASATGTITSAVASNKCLDDSANRRQNDNKIQLWSCNNTTAQQWTITSDGSIHLAGTNYCLDVKGAGTAQGTLVQLYTCNGTVAQKWTINYSNHTLLNPHSNKCLDDKYRGTANGNVIWIWPCNGTKAQMWYPPQISTPPATPTPTNGGSSSLEPGGQAMPGGISGWKQIFTDDFAGTVPKGAFSDCNHNTDTPQAYCGGLKNYGSYYSNWWAYPNGWDDTAKSGADGNTGAPFGGVYHPEDTVSVSSGAMHIKMYRPSSGGDNHVAALVPRACMQHEYGRYVERFKVVHADPGFKSAHLFYDGGYEIDYPENDYGDTIYAYTHPGEASFSSGAKWTSGWHTTAIEWTSGSVKFYMDGKVIGTTSTKVPHLKMSWVLQNESSILGPYAKAGASAQLDIDWVTCYAQG